MTAEKKQSETGLKKINGTDADSVRISPDVISIVAGVAAGEIEGIAGMSGGIVGGIAEKLGRKDISKGIKVHLEEDKVRIDLNVIVDFGVRIVDVANKLKSEVRSTVENITGLQVASININVLGLHVPREADEKADKEKEKEKEKENE
jgi:uncharacterized alkaline shock family protein YloU